MVMKDPELLEKLSAFLSKNSELMSTTEGIEDGFRASLRIGNDLFHVKAKVIRKYYERK